MVALSAHLTLVSENAAPVTKDMFGDAQRDKHRKPNGSSGPIVSGSMVDARGGKLSFNSHSFDGSSLESGHSFLFLAPR